jgi:hypothetical protein
MGPSRETNRVRERLVYRWIFPESPDWESARDLYEDSYRTAGKFRPDHWPSPQADDPRFGETRVLGAFSGKTLIGVVCITITSAE